MIVIVMPPFGATPFPCFSPLPSVSASSFLVAEVSSSGTVSCQAYHLWASSPEEGAVPATTRNSVGTSACGEEKRGVGGGVSVVILQVKLWLISPLMGEITWGV